MKIIGVEGMDPHALNEAIQLGGKFVIYRYTISIGIMTFRRSSDIHFIRGNENAVVKGLGYTFLTFVLGWWGIPWGPIYTIGSLTTNLKGGQDVPREALQMVSSQFVSYQ